MNDTRWFKLLIRAIGILCIAQSIPGLVRSVTTILIQMQLQRRWVDDLLYFSAEVFGGFVVVALGVYLLAGAPRLVRYCLTEVTHRCAACDYDLRGATGAVCPECGLPKPVIPETKP